MDLSCLMRGFSLYLGLGLDIGLGFTRDRFWQSTVHFAQRRFSRITVCHSITNPNPILRPLVPDTQFPEPNPQQKGSSLNISWGLLQIFDAQKSLGENRPTGTDKRPNQITEALTLSSSGWSSLRPEPRRTVGGNYSRRAGWWRFLKDHLLGEK